MDYLGGTPWRARLTEADRNFRVLWDRQCSETGAPAIICPENG
ncbi:hypothetical protein [Bradyrhizobium prioriisuperbiae]|nr:hypothetical protein [Bradyrhizobium prioritasuperba]